MRTFFIETLGCKVNHYESEQMAALLRGCGLVPGDRGTADLRIVHTCSVTTEAASKSRQATRRAIRLAVLPEARAQPAAQAKPVLRPDRGKTIVTGCWASSDPEQASRLPGVDAVLTHRDNIAQRLRDLIAQWKYDEGGSGVRRENAGTGTLSLPLLDGRQSAHQRAFLKIQDGCDAHCTYCIIPRLRPELWSRPVEEVLEEARRMVAAGHQEIVLTGIFLGAYGQATALRRRQEQGRKPLAGLIDALCTRVAGLRRLRLSSLEPGDLDEDCLASLRSHAQVAPHFHLPLQSGSDEILRRMNRQYRRDDFLRLVDRLGEAFDRPALTTDIIAGFPGETEADFEQTLEVARRARFIHIHAFPFSARPGTAAARWTADFVPGAVAQERIARLGELAGGFSREFRQSFVGQAVEVLVERGAEAPMRHGRCERYFDVWFEDSEALPGDARTIRIERVAGARTFGAVVTPPSGRA